MEINRLTKEQIEQIYTEHLIHDFGANERKPLSVVLKSLEMDAYECLRFSDKETLIGYAFFVKNAHDYMLDYFAIVRGMRDKGFGSHSARHLYPGLFYMNDKSKGKGKSY